MSIPLNVGGTEYNYPQNGDPAGWGEQASGWAIAVTSSMLQKSGGLFSLASNVDFGSSYGLVASHFTARSNDTSTVGSLRLARTDSIGFRNQANDGNLLLEVNNFDQLMFNNVPVVQAGVASIVDADINAAAQIAMSKLAALTASKVLVSDASGIISESGVSSTTLSYLDINSSLDSLLSTKLNLSGGDLSGYLTLHSNPTLDNQAATKQYVDLTAQGLISKLPVNCATTANLSLSGEQTIDGVLTSASRVLVKNQSTPTQNGIYLTSAGAWSRTSDTDTWLELVNAYAFVSNGTVNKFSGWQCAAVVGGTIGSNPVVWNQYSQAGAITTDGQGIEISGSQLSLELDGTSLSKSGTGLKLSAATEASINDKLINPLTTTGDIIYSSSGTTAERLGAGANGSILSLASGIPSWIASVGATQITDGAVTTSKVLDANITTIKIADANVTTAKLADASVTKAKQTAVGQQVSSSTSGFSTTSGSFVDITNLSVSITTTGRPIVIAVVSAGTGGNESSLNLNRASSNSSASIRLMRNGTEIAASGLLVSASGASSVSMTIPVSSFFYIDIPSAGTYTYQYQAAVTGTINVRHAKLVAYEI